MSVPCDLVAQRQTRVDTYSRGERRRKVDEKKGGKRGGREKENKKERQRKVS